jgi:hypothetical protein
MIVDRKIGQHKKLVYILAATRPHKYPWGKSRIVYVGTTETGVSRIASSVAARSEQAFAKWGVKSLEVHVIWCPPLQKVSSWKKLERAVLADFLSIYGDLPLCNKIGSFKWDVSVSKYFRRQAITNLLTSFQTYS